MTPYRNYVSEALESRTLLATTLPPGFTETYITRVVTQAASAAEFSPDGRYFVCDNRTGDVRIVKNNVLLTTPFLHVNVDNYRERGLESIAFDPNFATNRFVYVYYTVADPSTPQTDPRFNRLSRFRASSTNPDIADNTFGTNGEQILIDGIPSPTGIHNGGAMHFGADGKLYLGVGEGGQSSNAQTLSNLNGKILRLDVSGQNVAIPSDNPFVGTQGARGEIFAYGMRNPYTGAIFPGTNQLYINDVGQSTWEEIDDIKAGKNYGWPTAEGNSTNPAFTNPVYEYNHNGASAAITGGTFYNANQFPTSYKGKYFFSDYLNKWIKVFDPATKTASNWATSTFGFVDLDVAPDGSLWCLEIGGNIVKLSATGGGNRAPTAVATADKTSGPTPLVVNFSGTQSTDPDGDALSYTWNFGDGTNGSGATVQHTYSAAGTFNATVSVNDGHGGSDVSDPLTITPGNNAPEPMITAPVNNAPYRAGDTINFSGSATDTEDGTLAAGAFSWNIEFHHQTHTHFFINPINGVKSGSFTIPTTGETDPVQWYRIILTVKDSNNLSASTFVDVKPRTSTMTLASNISGLTLTMDGQSNTAPANVVGVVGMTRAIGAPSTQSLNGKTYAFVSWSDGGQQTHNITTLDANTTYTATFKEVPTSAITLRAVADAYVRSGTFASQNFGQSTDLAVKNSAGDFGRETYLRFDTSSASSVASAKLRLYGKISDFNSVNLVTAVYGVSDTTWGENAITWNTKPATSTGEQARQTIVDGNPRWYEFDVTNYVKAQKSANKNLISLVLKNIAGSSSYNVFTSDEATSNRPELVITPVTSGTTIGASADAYVRDGSSAGTNFGTATELQVKNSTAGYNRYSYLKFNIGSLGTINSAKLRLTGRLTVTGVGRTIAAYQVKDTSWSETGITWNNKPANETSQLASVVVNGTTNATYELDLTSFIQSEKALGHTTISLVLKATVASDAQISFASREAGSTGPQLVVS